MGQRIGLSEKDVQKINFMYFDECNKNTVDAIEVYEQMLQQQMELAPAEMPDDYWDTVITWFEDLFSFD